MKWLILALVIFGLVAAMIWYEAADRKLTQTQTSAVAFTALAAWLLALLLGNTML